MQYQRRHETRLLSAKVHQIRRVLGRQDSEVDSMMNVSMMRSAMEPAPCMQDVLISGAVEPVKNGRCASGIAVALQLLGVQLHNDDSWRRPVLRRPQLLQPCSPADLEAGQSRSSPLVRGRAQD